jgi:hypothetical protein
MIHVVVMNCLIDLPLLIHIFYEGVGVGSFKNRGVGVGSFKNRGVGVGVAVAVGVGVGVFVYRLHSPGY